MSGDNAIAASGWLPEAGVCLMERLAKESARTIRTSEVTPRFVQRHACLPSAGWPSAQHPPLGHLV
jgi:hypothetical protein